MGLTPVPDGHIATIVTSLEMTARPLPSPSPSAPLSLHEWAKPKPKAYRILFERVGAPWLWFSRLVMTDEALSAIIHHESVKIWAIRDPKGIEVGILELDFREPGQCEIAYFGLVPELAGKGLGRWLMAQTLGLAWRKDVNRVWVHTCTLDHASALGFYQRSGFVPFARAVETFADPRLIGLLPRDAAPQIPLFAPAS
jgi:GNAT superfamily N-acetyltransferase